MKIINVGHTNCLVMREIMWADDLESSFSIRACFTLQWRSPLVMNSTGILKFDWPRVTLLSGGGLHIGQDSFGGELCTWLK